MMLGIDGGFKVKSLDTWNLSRNVYQEYKTIISDKPDRLGKAIYEAKDQSPYIVIRNTGKISLNDAIEQTELRLKRHHSIKEVIIVHKNIAYVFKQENE